MPPEPEMPGAEYETLADDCIKINFGGDSCVVSSWHLVEEKVKRFERLWLERSSSAASAASSTEDQS